MIGFAETAAAVVAQVHDDGVDVILLHFLDKRAHIPGRTLEVLFAAGRGFEIEIESGQLDDADLEVAAVVWQFDDFRFRRLVFQPHRVAGDADDGRTGFVDCVGRNHVEAHHGAFFAANLGDDVIEPHADDILDFAFRPLADADDAVADAELGAALGRAALDQFDDGCVFVFPRKLRSYSLQRERKIHIEGFGVLRREIGGVGVGYPRHGRQIALERVFGIGL